MSPDATVRCVSRELLLLLAVSALLAGGGVARLSGSVPADVLWAAAAGVALVPTIAWVVADLRAGRWGADLLAVRSAVWFLPAALLLAAVAWAVTGDPGRAVAVLVTATPCPLLLAVRIAVTGGMSRASRAGVVVKDGTALELPGRAGVLTMDKTGTVTVGRPEVLTHAA